MTIQDKGTRIQAFATAGQTEFTFPFDIFANGDLKVYLTPVGQPSDPNADLLPTSAYVITLNGALPNDGKITLNTPAIAGDIITQQRDTPLARSTDFAVGGNFRADEINKQLDKLTAQIQQVETLIETRGVTYEVTDDLSAADNVLPQLTADTVWYKNGAGNIVAVDINGGDVNTLKAELASQTLAAPGSGIVGHYDTQVAQGTTVDAELNFLHFTTNTLDDKFTDLASQTMAAPGSALVGHYNTVASASTTVDQQLNTNTYLIDSRLFVKPGIFKGLTLSNNTTTPLRDLDIAAGIAADNALDNYLSLPGTFVKKIDVAWAEGTNMGGLLTGVLAANTTYHVYLINKTATGVADIGFEPAFPPTALPAGYGAYARIGSIVTDAGSNIVPFIQDGNYFLWKNPVQSPPVNFGTSGAQNLSAYAPIVAGRYHKAIVGVGISISAVGSDAWIKYTSLLQDDDVPTIQSFDAASLTEPTGSKFEVLLLNDQFRAHVAYIPGGSPGSRDLTVTTYGYIDKREGDTF